MTNESAKATIVKTPADLRATVGKPIPSNDKFKDLVATLDPGLRKAVEGLKATLEKSGFRQEVNELKATILKKPIHPEQQFFSFLPHQLAKTSIFFPMSDRELKEENRHITKIEHDTNWGKVIVQGVKLAIFEEDILLALLALLDKNLSKLNLGIGLAININEIIAILYGRTGYSKTNEDVILRALKHFELVSFDLIVGDWKKHGKERLKVERIRSVGNIISGYDYDTATKSLKIYFNPHFLAYFAESMLTNLNLTQRRKLKKDGSKALLRFLSAHTNPGRMHMLTVLNAINYNTDQPLYRLRSRLKSFIVELKKNGILGNKTKLFQDDMVYFDILPPQKRLPV